VALPRRSRRSQDQERNFWAFRHLQLPTVQHADQVRTPIDRFLLSDLEAEDGEFSAEANRRALARRVYLDLIGLLPTPEASARFRR